LVALSLRRLRGDIGAADLLPLISWAAVLGRCRHCLRRPSWFYPAIEIAALLIALIAV
jgi:leader peptidase (prepilin peptidase)/N-methyltransferase